MGLSKSEKSREDQLSSISNLITKLYKSIPVSVFNERSKDKNIVNRIYDFNFNNIMK